MSYILDALNKSEQERREQDNVPSLQAIHDNKSNGHQQSSNFRWVPIAVIVVLVSLLLVIVMLNSARNSDGAPQYSPAAISPFKQAATVQTALVHTRPTGVQFNQGTQATFSLPNVQSVNAGLNEGTSEGTSEEENKEINALYSQEGGANTAALATVPPQASTEALANSVATELVNSVAADYQSFDRAASFVPNVQNLPKPLQSRVPALDYSAHIYSSDERSGFAIINGRSRYKGDVLSRDLFVEAVEEDGLVLNVQGVSFKLPAMKSWQPPR